MTLSEKLNVNEDFTSIATADIFDTRLIEEIPTTNACPAGRQLAPHLISSHLISSHLISSHLISSHLISSHPAIKEEAEIENDDGRNKNCRSILFESNLVLVKLLGMSTYEVYWLMLPTLPFLTGSEFLRPLILCLRK